MIRKSKISLISLFGILLIITVVLLLFIKQKNNITTYLVNAKTIDNYLMVTSLNNNDDNKLSNNDYIAVLEIPKIKLKQGILDYDNIYNDVEYNIELLNSDMPNLDYGNMVLASHSGNTKVSYFNNLYKLTKGDIIIIYYFGNKYIYKLDNYYEVDKQGYINIVRNKNLTTLTLITCKNNDNKKQMVYVSYLTKKETY